MHHLKPSSKGDPLCPLGFHPQVRWPTRCKRCFRDYKEHGNRKETDSLRRDELTVSTPSLSSFPGLSRSRDESRLDSSLGNRTWTSSSNLSTLGVPSRKTDEPRETKSSWTSTPNLAEAVNNEPVTTVNVTLPRRRRPPSEPSNEPEEPRKTQYTRRLTDSILPSRRTSSPAMFDQKPRSEEHKPTADVDFIFHVKSSTKQNKKDVGKPPVPRTRLLEPPKDVKSARDSSPSSDEESIAATETTDTTLVNMRENELMEEVESLKKDLEVVRQRCEKAEREKSDLMLRRLATLDSTSSSKSENLKLQQKVNEMKGIIEDLRDDKRSLTLKVREVESELDVIKATGAQRELEQLRAKMEKAEQLVEQLMDENQDMRSEIRDMEEEMLEMQDSFREDQADEYSSLKKELEQTTKKCRILTFKLRKAERKNEQLDAEKLEMERKIREIAGGQAGLDKAERIRQLEHELNIANEAATRLQKELDEANSQLKEGSQQGKKKTPMLGSIPKTPSGEKVSRESLMRGGSQEDPAQLLRDLQDSLEREADLREQLKYAEEEAESLRKKASRVEDDNESLVLQLKKMATKARTRRHSPNRLTPEPEKDEGISDEEDPAELRIQLELLEQETAVLRRKVEDLEKERDTVNRKNKDLQDKLTAKLSTVAKKEALSNDNLPMKDSLYQQKMKVMEGETSELRMKLIEKERECERLHAELTLGAKKPKLLQKSKSLDGDQQTVDLKRQLQVIESEAAILRTKILDFESENEKLLTENKKLIMLKGARRAGSVERTDEPKPLVLATLEKHLDEAKRRIKELEAQPKVDSPPTASNMEVDKLKTQLKKSEANKKKAEESLKRLQEETILESLSFFNKRTPRRPTEVSTKLQLKKMVEESELEISELLISLKKAESINKSSSNSIKSESSLKESNEELMKKEKELEEIRKHLKELEQEKIKLKKDNDSIKSNWEKEKTKLEESKTEIDKKKNEAEKEIAELKKDLKNLKQISNDLSNSKKEVESLAKKLEEEKKITEEFKKKQDMSKDTEAERKKLKSEVEEAQSKSVELEGKLKELEEKLKKSEKLVSLKKEKLSKLEKEKSEKETKLESLEKESSTLQKEKQDLKSKVEEIETKVKKLNIELEKKNKVIEELENKSDNKIKASSKDTVTKEELNLAKEELESTKNKLKDANEKLNQVEKEKEDLENASKSKEKELQKDIQHWEKKVSELENDIQVETEKSAAERKIMERLKANQELEIKTKDQEIAQLQSKNLASGTKKLNDLRQEMQSKIDRLEVALDSEKREYEELTGKYEQLEEEHLVIKAQLVKEKEMVHSQLLTTEHELNETEAELKALRETFTSKQDLWIKEKLKLQDKIKNSEDTTEKHQMECTKMLAICDGKQTELEQFKKESRDLMDQSDRLRKDNEELRRQIEDFDKVVKVQRNMTADVTALEKELKDYKTRLVMEQKTRKSELAGLKSRYDNRVAVLSNELLGVQGQVARFKKERDSYKKMMEEAQRSMSDMKEGITPSNRISYDGEDSKSHIAQLEQQISCFEDELSEARVESSRLRTELLSERSAWEIKLSELTSKLNEVEEEKILSSGRTKITGLKTRMELAWHKERDEQQRLLQETSTLARDLRQTLFEVERERDRERLEAKRRIDQVKKNAEEEQEEMKKKLHDIQCDLLELRDAHAKLRTTNEKLRRERDRWDRERDAIRHSMSEKKKLEQEDERKIITVAQLVEELTTLAPDLFPSKPKSSMIGPTPPVRRKSRSREASPLLERKEFSRESSVGREDGSTKNNEVQEIMFRLSEAAQQLKKYSTEDRELEKSRRAHSKRHGSTDSDSGLEPLTVQNRGLNRKNSSLRKSLSLEQTAQDQAIWSSDNDREGSVTSVQSYEDDPYQKVYYKRDQSLDSRLSSGSTRSEVITSSEKKKKSGLFGKLKRLARAKSVESDYGSDLGSASQLDPGSDSSLHTAEERSSRHLKDKLSGMFKRSGSSSRGNSMERNIKPPTGLGSDSMQRPLVSSEMSSSLSEASGTSKVSKKPPSSQKKPKK